MSDIKVEEILAYVQEICGYGPEPRAEHPVTAGLRKFFEEKDITDVKIPATDTHINNVWEDAMKVDFPTIEDAHELIDCSFELFSKKGKAYGPSWKTGGPVLLATMLLVKAVRLYNLVGKLQFGVHESHFESIMDSLKDNQNYLVMLFKQLKNVEEANEAGEEITP